MSKLIGTNPNQVPTNADLGTMAYRDQYVGFETEQKGDTFYIYEGAPRHAYEDWVVKPIAGTGCAIGLVKYTTQDYNIYGDNSVRWVDCEVHFRIRQDTGSNQYLRINFERATNGCVFAFDLDATGEYPSDDTWSTKSRCATSSGDGGTYSQHNYHFGSGSVGTFTNTSNGTSQVYWRSGSTFVESSGEVTGTMVIRCHYSRSPTTATITYG
jgi:hypothetical protein